MRREGLIPSKGGIIGTGIVFILAWQIWLLGFDLIETFAPNDPIHTFVKRGPWIWIQLFGPLILTVLFYKITIRIIDHRWRQGRLNELEASGRFRRV